MSHVGAKKFFAISTVIASFLAGGMIPAHASVDYGPNRQMGNFDSVTMAHESFVSPAPHGGFSVEGKNHFRVYVSELEGIDKNFDGFQINSRKTYTYYLSREQVRSAKKSLDAFANACSFVPLPWPFGAVCGGPAGMADAINRAYYQNKRVKMVYHPCFNYCAYYDFYVVN